MRYLISYDLTQPRRDYDDLITALQKQKALRVLESVWILESNLEPLPLVNDITAKGKLDDNDRIIAVELTGRAAWNRLLASKPAVIQALGPA
jgi:CRISPR/Cas system-associated endoribonuclease Cas2